MSLIDRERKDEISRSAYFTMDKCVRQGTNLKDDEAVNGHCETFSSPNDQKHHGRTMSCSGVEEEQHKCDDEIQVSHRKAGGRQKCTRSMYGVIPHEQFGPKAYLSSVSSVTISEPSSQKLMWTKPPVSVLVIRKHLDNNVLIPFSKMVSWLVEDKKLKVYVEHHVLSDPILGANEEFKAVRNHVIPFVQGQADLTNKVDFIICLGGDGTLLYASSLFQVDVPPVMAFNMGSLGFLTPFQFDLNFKNNVSKVMEGSPPVLLHDRLKCVLVSGGGHLPHVKKIQKENNLVKAYKLVLNEVVVDRGPSSFLSNFELYIEGRRVTSVQGDGLIISTPTGSTAYAVAAGASMVHPSVPCILITPICPHSLSFRPIVVPAGVEIKVMLCPNARNTCMVSFDGRDRMEMLHGDTLLITTACYPVPSICAVDQIEDWFESLAVCLNWNVRRSQNALDNTNSHNSLESLDSDTTSYSQSSALSN